MARKRLVGCDFLCNEKIVDFNVWLRKGATAEEACWGKLKAVRKGNVNGCELYRSRSLDGIPTSSGPKIPADVVSHAERACEKNFGANPALRSVCKDGVRTLAHELRREKILKPATRVRIVPE